ncbi:MAG: hypothetical protein M3Q97_00625, partial [Bacteroidota bacterium]|nr:hypothetical protein [Bacteroidota bacterium]
MSGGQHGDYYVALMNTPPKAPASGALDWEYEYGAWRLGQKYDSIQFPDTVFYNAVVSPSSSSYYSHVF